MKRPSELDDRNWLNEQYPAKSASRIARELRTTRVTVTRALKRHGIALTRTHRRFEELPSQLHDRAWLEKELRDKPMRLIAEELGVSYSVVRRAVFHHGITVPERTVYRMTVDKSEAVKRALAERYPNGRFGSLSPRWKGGIRKVPNGYVWIHREIVEQRWPDHPRLQLKGWTTKQEHILVWEAVNGLLPKGWVIDHKDRNKHNNALDNLQPKESTGVHISDHFGCETRAQKAEARAALLESKNRILRSEKKRLEARIRELEGR